MTAAEEVAHFFTTTLPQWLSATPERGDAYQCRFCVDKVGVWNLDFRRPFQSCRPHDSERAQALPPGVGRPTVILSAATWIELRQGRGSALPRLLESGAVRVTDDYARGIQTLTTLLEVEAPPIRWPISLRYLPLEVAFFRSSREALHEMLSKTTVDNIPLEPPFPHALYLSGRYWWEELLDFYLLLVPEDGDAKAALDEDDGLEVVFPMEKKLGNLNVHGVPHRFTQAAATLADERLVTKPGHIGRSFSQLRPLALAAEAESQQLWLWANFGALGM